MGILSGGNYLWGNCPGAIIRAQLSRRQLSQGTIILGGNCPRGNCPGGNFPRGQLSGHQSYYLVMERENVFFQFYFSCFKKFRNQDTVKFSTNIHDCFLWDYTDLINKRVPRIIIKFYNYIYLISSFYILSHRVCVVISFQLVSRFIIILSSR